MMNERLKAWLRHFIKYKYSGCLVHNLFSLTHLAFVGNFGISTELSKLWLCLLLTQQCVEGYSSSNQYYRINNQSEMWKELLIVTKLPRIVTVQFCSAPRRLFIFSLWSSQLRSSGSLSLLSSASFSAAAGTCLQIKSFKTHYLPSTRWLTHWVSEWSLQLVIRGGAFSCYRDQFGVDWTQWQQKKTGTRFKV